MVCSALVLGMSSVAYARAGVSLLGIAGRFTSTGICSSRTPAVTGQGETPGPVHALSEVRRVTASVCTHLWRRCFWSLLYLNVEGSLGSSLSFINTLALKSLRRAPSNICISEKSAKAPLVIIMWLMLSYARIKASTLMFPHSSWSLLRHFKYSIRYISTGLLVLGKASFSSAFDCTQYFLNYPFIDMIISWRVSEK